MRWTKIMSRTASPKISPGLLLHLAIFGWFFQILNWLWIYSVRQMSDRHKRMSIPLFSLIFLCASFKHETCATVKPHGRYAISLHSGWSHDGVFNRLKPVSIRPKSINSPMSAASFGMPPFLRESL